MLGLQRYAGSMVTQFFRHAAYSGSARPAPIAAAAATIKDRPAGTKSESAETPDVKKTTKNPLVAAAFESLNDDSTNSTKRKVDSLNGDNNIDARIVNAKTVNGLLSITEINGNISRKHALKIVSILAEWSSIERVKLSEFENDSRFLRVCRVLGRTVPKNNGATSGGNAQSNNEQKRISGFRTDDLNTVLGVAGDDEAAKLIASISLPQMVKVMCTLAQRKRRSTPLLRSLSFNISSSAESLNLKQCADVLFSMATLNFQDSVMAAKICADIHAGLPKNNEKSAVVGSILTSLGILKYRDLDILEALTQWTLKNSDICRPQDLSALFLTSSMLNFKSGSVDEVRQKLVKSIVREDFTKSIDWLNHVWSLALQGLSENKHLESVLSAEFVQQIEAENKCLSPTVKMKLLNLNSIGRLLTQDYSGPFLSDDSEVFKVLLGHPKSKQVLLNGMLDALKSLLPASNHLKTLVDSRMGFLIDAICLFDAKRNPLPADKDHDSAIKVALMMIDYNDVCHGPHRAASGITRLSFELLEKIGYIVVPVPYNEFNTSDKLLKRVQYLEGKFKTVISSKK